MKIRRTVEYLQTLSHEWVVRTFQQQSSETRRRGFRFIEEAVEFVEALGMSRDEVHKMVDYVFDRGRPGDPPQEVGGVMITLATCAEQNDISIGEAWWNELQRCEANSEKIREKDKAKPTGVKA